MNILLILLIVVAAGAVVVALVRGLVAFATMKADGSDEAIAANQAQQNKMMFARVKYQAIAIVLVALLLLIAGGQS
ncbi:MAG: HIG1 domain-containing protein [Parasphingorhabdus sp.]|nr:HIG1 domain-containing protein [Parasphingorhabdus sp.]